MELTRPLRSKLARVPPRVSTLVRFPALLKLVVCPAAVVTLFPPPGWFTVPGVFAPPAAPVCAAVVVPVCAAFVLPPCAAFVVECVVAEVAPCVVALVPPRVVPLVPPCAVPPGEAEEAPPCGVVLEAPP